VQWKEFIGLQIKMFSYIKDNNENSKIAKGIKKIVIEKDNKHEDYKNTLFNGGQMYHAMKTVRSDNNSAAMKSIKYHCHASMISGMYN